MYMKEYRTGSHSKYDLKYHVVWCPKYRYNVITGEVAERVQELVREIRKANYAWIVSGHVRLDHVHLLVSIPPNIPLTMTKNNKLPLFFPRRSPPEAPLAGLGFCLSQVNHCPFVTGVKSYLNLYFYELDIQKREIV